MKRFVGNASGKVILDIGAGNNPVSTGIISKKTIRIDGNKEFSPDIVCDINKKIPLKGESVDIIIAGEIIEHAFNPYSFLQECFRVLNKKGLLVLSTPNVSSLKNRIRVLLGLMPEHCARARDYYDKNLFQTHKTDYNLKYLTHLIKKNGFSILENSTNGIIFRNKLIFPSRFTPTSLGEILIIKAIKK